MHSTKMMEVQSYKATYHLTKTVYSAFICNKLHETLKKKIVSSRILLNIFKRQMERIRGKFHHKNMTQIEICYMFNFLLVFSLLNFYIDNEFCVWHLHIKCNKIVMLSICN